MEHRLTEKNSDAVVLLHGLGRGTWSMAGLGRRLVQAGFQVHNLGYPRRADSMVTVLAGVARSFNECGTEESNRVHFVTHSFGGLVLRAFLAGNCPVNSGRAVMLAPPNGGSQIVDRLGGWRLFGWLLGPLTPQLGTGPDGFPSRLPVPPCEFGVIAGSRWINPLAPLFLPTPNDGTVSIAQTCLAGMCDHLVVPYNHTFLMDAPLVARQVIHFLNYGRFEVVP